MGAKDLEAAVTAFYDGAYDVLLSTNIIESGLDLPRVNTLIVHRADMFGLAQLYQLRGRVGRSKARAYAYLTLPPSKLLTGHSRSTLHRIFQELPPNRLAEARELMMLPGYAELRPDDPRTALDFYLRLPRYARAAIRRAYTRYPTFQVPRSFPVVRNRIPRSVAAPGPCW